MDNRVTVMALAFISGFCFGMLFLMIPAVVGFFRRLLRLDKPVKQYVKKRQVQYQTAARRPKPRQAPETDLVFAPRDTSMHRRRTRSNGHTDMATLQQIVGRAR